MIRCWLGMVLWGWVICSGLWAEPPQLRVLSYNIHHGEGVDGRLDLERIAKVMQSYSPDLVCVQEVDRLVVRSKQVDQASELGRLLNMTPLFEKNIDLQGGYYGNAILTKLPVLGHRNIWLPMVREGEQRGVLVAELYWPAIQQSFTVYSTHLDHRPGDDDRNASAEKINAMVRDRSDPCLLLGDLNAVPDSQPLSILQKEWKRANNSPLPTIPVNKPTRQIDYVLHRDLQNRWKVLRVDVLDEEVASDHRAIGAVLQWDSKTN